MESQNQMLLQYDALDLYEDSLQVRQLLDPSETTPEKINYSCLLKKYNRYGLQQDRTLIITDRKYVTLESTFSNYKVHRQQPINKIAGFTISTDPQCYELVVHVQ